MKTILIVEDNEVIRNEINDIFSMENYNVIEASNGLEGYIKAINDLPDIIISDIMMPILNGFDMYKKLKLNRMTENIPVIFLSALSSNEDIRRGMNFGVDDYLTKPIIPDDLILATENKLQKYSKIENKIENLKIDITNVLYHELNTPLNGIIGFSDYLKTRLHEISKKDMQQIVDNIYISGIRLHKLVNKYLCFAELKMKSTEKNKIKELRKCLPTDIDKIIKEVLDSDFCNDRILDFEVKTKSQNVKIESTMLKKILEELIENAIKFSSKGNKITVKSINKKDNFIISIKNEGNGLTQKQINKIGDFCQFDKKRNAQNGSGIGLSIVKLVADIYNFSVNFESVRGKHFTANLVFNNTLIVKQKNDIAYS